MSINKKNLLKERLAHRLSIKYLKTLDPLILRDMNPYLYESFYNCLSESYDNYQYKRQYKSKQEIFKALNESLKLNYISPQLKQYIKNILIG